MERSCSYAEKREIETRLYWLDAQIAIMQSEKYNNLSYNMDSQYATTENADPSYIQVKKEKPIICKTFTKNTLRNKLIEEAKEFVKKVTF